MKEKFILALDQGTTSSRAILFDQKAGIKGIAQREFRQYYPRSGWVEHDAEEIWETQLTVARRVLEQESVEPGQIVAVGITNQRETTVIWDRTSGKPVHRAIVWQDRRTAERCDALRAMGKEVRIGQLSGLVPDAYFSGTKAEWILQQVEGGQARAAAGELLFGTIDTWLIWKLSGGKVHATDASNASRTMLMDIRKGSWSSELCELLKVPMHMLPEIRDSSGDFGTTDPQWFGGVGLPIYGVAGDQQAALFGQGCVLPGQAKNTYGTGCFLLMQTGEQAYSPVSGLLSTVAWQIKGKRSYALEGSVFVAGAAIQWLRDGLGLIREAAESEALAASVPDAGGVYLVPAFTGLGAPHWDMYARGAFFGLSRGTTRAHLVRAALESIAYQTREVLDAMSAAATQPLRELRVDGGAAANNLLMQFQADMLGIPVIRPQVLESTALGAACLAGLHSGFYSESMLRSEASTDRSFEPEMDSETRDALYRGWSEAVRRTGGWLRDAKGNDGD